MGQLLNGSGGGARLKYNFFIQPDEPTIKDGVWIQSLSKKEIQDIVIKPNFFRANTIIDDSLCEFVEGSKKRVNNMVWLPYCKENRYLYGVEQYYSSGSGYANLYKYDTLTDTLTEVGNRIGKTNQVNTSYTIMHGIVYEVYGNHVGYNTILYPEYDLFTDTLISSNYITTPFNNENYYGTFACDVSAYESLIVSFNGNNAFCYMYDINTNTFTNISLDLAKLSGCQGQNWTGNRAFEALGSYTAFYTNLSYYGGFLYIGLTNKLIKLDIISKTATAIETPFISSRESNPTVSIGEKIYWFTCNNLISNSTYQSEVYVFDMVSNSFSHLCDTPIGYVANFATYIPSHGVILMSKGFSGIEAYSYQTSYMRNKQLAFTSELQKINSLCLQNGTKYRMRLLNTSQLYKTLKYYTNSPIKQNEFIPLYDFSIDDAWYYDTDFKEYPTYIGNGITWTKIKN